MQAALPVLLRGCLLGQGVIFTVNAHWPLGGASSTVRSGWQTAVEHSSLDWGRHTWRKSRQDTACDGRGCPQGRGQWRPRGSPLGTLGALF